MEKQVKEKIVELRKKDGMTQQQLAEKLFVTPQAVSRWENGETEPDTNTLIKISEIFNVSLDELISGKKEEQKEKEVILIKEYTDTKKIPFVMVAQKNGQTSSVLYSDFAVNNEVDLKKTIISQSVIWGGLSLIWCIIALVSAISEGDFSLFAYNAIVAIFVGSSLISWFFNNTIKRYKFISKGIASGETEITHSLFGHIFNVLLITIRSIIGPVFLIISAMKMASAFSHAKTRVADLETNGFTGEIQAKYENEIYGYKEV